MILNPFPELLALSFFAPLLLRTMLGLWFVLTAMRHARRAERDPIALELAAKIGAVGRIGLWPLMLGEGALGVALIAGFYTQIAALLAGAYALKLLFFRRIFPRLASESAWFYLLAAALSLSLLVLGAGAFAVDLPL